MDFKHTHDIADATISIFGVVFSVGGILGFIQMGVAIIVSVVSALWMWERYKKIKRENKKGDDA